MQLIILTFVLLLLTIVNYLLWRAGNKVWKEYQREYQEECQGEYQLTNI